MPCEPPKDGRRGIDIHARSSSAAARLVTTPARATGLVAGGGMSQSQAYIFVVGEN
jgi:hypothetical protein